MKSAGLLVAAIFVFASGAAQAASCNARQMEGLWVGTADERHPSYCLLEIRPDGRIREGSCFDPPAIKPSAISTGKLTLATDCTVTGTLAATSPRGKRRVILKFTGTLDPEKGQIRGTLKVKGGPAAAYGYARHWR